MKTQLENLRHWVKRTLVCPRYQFRGSHSEWLTFTLEDGSELMLYLRLTPYTVRGNTRATLVLASISVPEEYQKRGLATQIYQTLIAIAKDHNLRSVVENVNNPDFAAHLMRNVYHTPQNINLQ